MLLLRSSDTIMEYKRMEVYIMNDDVMINEQQLNKLARSGSIKIIFIT